MSTTTEPGALVGEKVAIAIGAVLTFVAGWLFFTSLVHLLSFAGHAVLFLIGLYLVGAVAQFWLSQSYEDGLTGRELRNTGLWFLDARDKFLAGTRPSHGVGAFVSKSSQAATEPVVIPVGIASIATGVVGSLLFGFIGAWLVITQVAAIGISALWLLVPVYVIGFVFTFWASKAYRQGLTPAEIVSNLVWPVAYVAQVRLGVNRLRSKASVSQAYGGPVS